MIDSYYLEGFYIYMYHKRKQVQNHGTLNHLNKFWSLKDDMFNEYKIQQSHHRICQ